MQSGHNLLVAGVLIFGACAASIAAHAASASAIVAADGAKPASIVRLVQQSDAYRPNGGYGAGDNYRPDGDGGDGGYAPQGRSSGSGDVYRPQSSRSDDAYRPSGSSGYGSGSAYNSGPQPYREPRGVGGDGYQGRTAPPSGGYGAPYAPPAGATARGPDADGYPEPQGPSEYDERKYYSKNEIVNAGHGFFGSISQGLASVIEHAFKTSGRPNGYILGEDAGGAFVAGLRYGEGRLYTKDAGTHKVYWQGPSVGYDFGGAGAKTMILVYNLRDPSEIYHRFGGVEGSAYLVGGVSIQFQKYGDVVMAPIRAGIGLRLGANVGYLKYTRKPTWNPF